MRVWSLIYVPYLSEEDVAGDVPVKDAELVSVIARDIREANELGLGLMEAATIEKRGYKAPKLELRLYKHASIPLSMMRGL